MLSNNMGGLLDFMKTPEGQGLLSAVAGGLATARRGTPWNNLGKAGLAGLAGYGSALNQVGQAEERQLTAEQKRFAIDKQRQEMAAAEASKAATAKYLSAFGDNSASPSALQALAAGVPIETLESINKAREFGKTKVARTETIMGADGKPIVVALDEQGNQTRVIGEKPDMLNAYQAQQLGISQANLALAQANALRAENKQRFDMGELPLPSSPPSTGGPRATIGGPLPAGFPTGSPQLPISAQSSTPEVTSTPVTSQATQAFLNNRMGGKPPEGYLWSGVGNGIVPIQGYEPKQLAEKKSLGVKDAQEALDIIAEAKTIIPKATGSGVGSVVDTLGRAVGYSTEGDIATGQLKALAGNLVAKMPKMSGPQSDKDVALYKEMAADIGDPTIPTARKLAALSTVEKLQKKYAGAASGTGDQRAKAAASPMKGQVIDGYKFNGGNPADPKSWSKQ